MVAIYQCLLSICTVSIMYKAILGTAKDMKMLRAVSGTQKLPSYLNNTLAQVLQEIN